MNFLSHYYLGRHKEDPHFTLGLVLPDLARNNDKALRFRDGVLEAASTSNAMKHLHEGVQFHHLTDHLFHNSPYFEEKSQELKAILLKYPFQSLKKHYHFLAHIALELMLDRMLLKEDPQLCDQFYISLENVKDNAIVDYFGHTGYADKAAAFIDFLYLFNKNKYIQHYVKTESMAFALGRIYHRATGLDIHEDKALLCEFVEEAETKAFVNYKDVFTQLNIRLVQ